MAYDAFLKLDGIDGESTDQNHEKWIEITSFSWGETNAGTTNHGAGGGGGAGKVSFQDFHFTSLTNKASPSLFQACATGQHIRTATLSLANQNAPADAAGVPSADFMKWNLTNVLVSSYQTGGTLLDDGTYSPLGANSADGFTGDVPVEQFSLNFFKIDVAFTSQVDGSTTDLSADVDGNTT